MKQIVILCIAALVVALPFIFRQQHSSAGNWEPGDPTLIIVTPHNEAIRQEFGEAFSRWHEKKYGAPVNVDWRMIGGTTEIMRYLASEYTASAKGFVRACQQHWPQNGAQAIFAATAPTTSAERICWELFRTNDSPSGATAHMDLFFGGGAYDHSKAQRQGLTIPAWGTNAPPADLFSDAAHHLLIPSEMNGESWCGKAYYGTALSGFGICYNVDRLRDLGIVNPPKTWSDLTAPAYAGFIGMTDPTKSGSVAKAFEMIVHAECAAVVAQAGYTHQQIRAFETTIQTKKCPFGQLPADVPPAYQQALEKGWYAGLNLLRRLGANALYFADSSTKVPIDVSMGAVAAGVCIDFLGRFQSELSTPPGEKPVMAYVTPIAGTSMTADPISLLRGAPHRVIAVRFIEFVLGEEGQKLWNYRPGTPGGPRRFALRRLPIRRDFYPSSSPHIQKKYEQHQAYLSDPLGNPDTDAYRLAESFLYEPRWTAQHFGILRDLFRAMCMDSGEELRSAWKAILAAGGPEKNPEAMALLQALPQHPVPLTWESAVTYYAKQPRMDVMRDWTAFFRARYRAAHDYVIQHPPQK